MRGVLAAAASALVVTAGTGCGTHEPAATAQEPLPTMSVSGELGTEVLPTAAELISDSYVVARGRFTGEPTVVHTQGDEVSVTHQVVWEFVPDEVYRDVRAPEAPGRLDDERRGSFLVGASVNDVGAMRGDVTVETFLGTRPSTYNLNSYLADRSVYVFLRPGSLPRDVVQERPELADILILAAPGHCYVVDDLAQSCAYVADNPGGEPVATLDPGAMTPRGLTAEAVEGSGSVPDVVGSEYFTESQPIDVGRYRVLPGGGGEG
jgi:hypothetical protein